MDHNIYEEMYERLLSEGLDEDIATAVVNKMHDREELHDAEYIDEGIFKAATTIGRVAARMMGYGKVSSQAARGAGAGTLRIFNRRGSQAFQRGVRRRNWTPDKALPSGTPAGVRQKTLASLTGGSATPKSGGLVTTGRGGTLAPGKGGALASGGGKLGPVSKIEPVTVKDLGPNRMAAGQTKAATAATGSKGTGVTYQGTRSGGQLPPAGQTTSRVGRAQQKAADAAKGNLKELEAIAAAVIGGVVLTGGFGTILGICVGAFIFGIAKEAFFYIPGIDGSFYRVFLGLVIIASALTNENIRKRIIGSI